MEAIIITTTIVLFYIYIRRRVKKYEKNRAAERAKEFFITELTCLHENKFDEGLVLLNTYLENQTRNKDVALWLKARMYEGKKEYNQALYFAEQALAINAHMPEAYVVRANCYNALGETEKATDSAHYAERLTQK